MVSAVLISLYDPHNYPIRCLILPILWIKKLGHREMKHPPPPSHTLLSNDKTNNSPPITSLQIWIHCKVLWNLPPQTPAASLVKPEQRRPK